MQLLTALALTISLAATAQERPPFWPDIINPSTWPSITEGAVDGVPWRCVAWARRIEWSNHSVAYCAPVSRWANDYLETASLLARSALARGQFDQTHYDIFAANVIGVTDPSAPEAAMFAAANAKALSRLPELNVRTIGTSATAKTAQTWNLVDATTRAYKRDERGNVIAGDLIVLATPRVAVGATCRCDMLAYTEGATLYCSVLGEPRQDAGQWKGMPIPEGVVARCKE